MYYLFIIIGRYKGTIKKQRLKRSLEKDKKIVKVN